MKPDVRVNPTVSVIAERQRRIASYHRLILVESGDG
jgi:hypothetical protein